MHGRPKAGAKSSVIQQDVSVPPSGTCSPTRGMPQSELVVLPVLGVSWPGRAATSRVHQQGCIQTPSRCFKDTRGWRYNHTWAEDRHIATKCGQYVIQNYSCTYTSTCLLDRCATHAIAHKHACACRETRSPPPAAYMQASMRQACM